MPVLQCISRRIKSYNIQVPVILFLVVGHQFLHQQIFFLTAFQNLIQNYLRKNFRKKFPLFNGFTGFNGFR